MDTQNTVANYLFEKTLAEHDASKAKDTEIADLQRNLEHVRSMLKTETDYSRSTLEKLNCERAARLAADKKVADLTSIIQKDARRFGDLVIEVVNLSAALTRAKNEARELSAKYVKLQRDAVTVSLAYLTNLDSGAEKQ